MTDPLLGQSGWDTPAIEDVAPGKQIRAFDDAVMALRNALSCDAHAPEIRNARTAAMRVENTAADLAKALKRVVAYPEPADD